MKMLILNNDNIILNKNEDGIEWESEGIKKHLNLTPLINDNYEKRFPIAKDCYFDDEIWDFNSFNKINKPKTNFKIDFSSISSYKEYVKEFALRQLVFRGNRVISVKLKVNIIREFINWLNKNNIVYIETVNSTLLQEYFKGMNFSEKVISKKKFTIKEFLSVIAKRQNCNFNDAHRILNKVNKEKIKQQQENCKHKLIPYLSTKDKISPFDKIVFHALNDLKDENLSINRRLAACMIVILAETGMRIGEFRILEVNKISEIKHPIDKTKPSQHILHFITYKTTPEKDGRWTYTFVTPNALLAYKTLVDITKERRKNSKQPKYAVLSEKCDIYSCNGTLWRHNKSFYYHHQDDLGFNKMNDAELKQFHIWTPTKHDLKGWMINNEKDIGKVFYYATNHQYRVTCATILYVRQGKKLEWIRRHMNHLSLEMTEHYIREEAKKKEQIGIAKALIMRSNKSGTELEVDSNKINDQNIRNEIKDAKLRKAYKEINKFLNKLSTGRKKINIKRDIKEIIDALYEKKIPLTELEMGFCTLDALEILCDRQKHLDRLEDLDIHIPTIENILISYKRYLDKKEVIEYDSKLLKENSSYKSSYDREVKYMKLFIQNRFLPELNLLESEIKMNGTSAIIEKYKDIEIIIPKLNKLKEEVLIWQNK